MNHPEKHKSVINNLINDADIEFPDDLYENGEENKI
jgi:hypothetical protein